MLQKTLVFYRMWLLIFSRNLYILANKLALDVLRVVKTVQSFVSCL